MPDSIFDQPQETQIKLVPPSGDSKKAEKYISKLIELINKDRLTVTHTDLKKFDPNALEDHYQLDLGDHQAEVSHGKQPTTGKDFYTILFNNLQQVRDGCTEKIILAYMHLNEDQFKRFAAATNDHHTRKVKEIEEKKFADAIKPIDEALDNLLKTEEETEQKEKSEIEENFQDALDNINPFGPLPTTTPEPDIPQPPASANPGPLTDESPSILDSFLKPTPNPSSAE